MTEATLDNGCLVVLPKQSDPLWARADHPGHTRAATEVGGDGPAGGGGAGQVTELRFPVAAARPLPARKGALIAWHGNTVHWGGACSARAKVPPRKNLAFTFRRAVRPGAHPVRHSPSSFRKGVRPGSHAIHDLSASPLPPPRARRTSARATSPPCRARRWTRAWTSGGGCSSWPSPYCSTPAGTPSTATWCPTPSTASMKTRARRWRAFKHTTIDLRS